MRRLVLLAAGLAAAVALVYLPILQNGFVNWDDPELILQNAGIHELGLRNLAWMFTTLYWTVYQPLAWLAWAAVIQVQGLDPVGFHAASLAVHLAVCVGLFLACRRLIRLGMPEAPAARADLASAAGAAVFGLHPIHAETVANASGFADLLAALFFVLSILAYLHRPHRGWLALSWVLFVMSGLSRWRGVSLPFVLLILDLYPLRRIGAKLPGSVTLREALLEKLPFFAVSLAIVAVNAKGKGLDAGSRLPGVTEACAGLLFFLWKAVVPTGFAPFYPPGASGTPLSWPQATNIGLAVAVTAFLTAQARRWPAVAAVWFQYLLAVAPTLGFFKDRPMFVYDRYAYVAFMGLPMLAAAGLLKASGRARALAAGTAAAALLALGWLAHRQCMVWHDPRTLWTNALIVTPGSAVALTRLGDYDLESGRYDDAIVNFRKALDSSPGHADIHNRLGIAHFHRGDLSKAMSYYAEALREDPGLAEAEFNMGVALARLGRFEEAAQRFRRHLELQPGHPLAAQHLQAAVEAERAK